MRPVGIRRRSFCICAAIAARVEAARCGNSGWNRRSSATTSTPRSSARQPRRDRERGLRELERGAGGEPDRVAAGLRDRARRSRATPGSSARRPSRTAGASRRRRRSRRSRARSRPSCACAATLESFARRRSPRPTPYGAQVDADVLRDRDRRAAWKIWRSSGCTLRGNSTSSASGRSSGARSMRARLGEQHALGLAARAEQRRELGGRARDRQRAVDAGGARARPSRARSRDTRRRPSDRCATRARIVPATRFRWTRTDVMSPASR